MSDNLYDNLYAVGRMVYTADEVIVELNSKMAALSVERDRYRQALVEINEMFSNLANIATMALKEKE
jgi:hypothetical protein